MHRWIYALIGCVTTTLLLKCAKPELWGYAVVLSVANMFVWGRYGYYLFASLLADAIVDDKGKNTT